MTFFVPLSVLCQSKIPIIPTLSISISQGHYHCCREKEFPYYEILTGKINTTAFCQSTICTTEQIISSAKIYAGFLFSLSLWFVPKYHSHNKVSGILRWHAVSSVSCTLMENLSINTVHPKQVFSSMSVNNIREFYLLDNNFFCFLFSFSEK